MTPPKGKRKRAIWASHFHLISFCFGNIPSRHCQSGVEPRTFLERLQRALVCSTWVSHDAHGRSSIQMLGSMCDPFDTHEQFSCHDCSDHVVCSSHQDLDCLSLVCVSCMPLEDLPCASCDTHLLEGRWFIACDNDVQWSKIRLRTTWSTVEWWSSLDIERNNWHASDQNSDTAIHMLNFKRDWTEQLQLLLNHAAAAESCSCCKN
jgi:hypothetical protein